MAEPKAQPKPKVQPKSKPAQAQARAQVANETPHIAGLCTLHLNIDRHQLNDNTVPLLCSKNSVSEQVLNKVDLSLTVKDDDIT